MPKSGKDIIEIRENVRKKVFKFFNDNLERSMKQLGPQSIQRFTEFFEFQFPEKEASKKNVSDFISTMIASFIVFHKLRTMPREIFDFCKMLDDYRNNDNDTKNPYGDDTKNPFDTSFY